MPHPQASSRLNNFLIYVNMPCLFMATCIIRKCYIVVSKLNFSVLQMDKSVSRAGSRVYSSREVQQTCTRRDVDEDVKLARFSKHDAT